MIKDIIDSGSMSADNPVIEVWPIDEACHPYPWRFAVTFEGTRHMFAGIPNQCESIAEALVKAHERTEWMKDGTFRQRYR